MIAAKRYACKACGYAKEIQTNHYGECYSAGNYNRCPDCGPLPPDPRCPQAVRYPVTVWVCQETNGTGKTVQQYLAEQTDTDPNDWVPVLTNTKRHKDGYRWWNKQTNQYAKRPPNGQHD